MRLIKAVQQAVSNAETDGLRQATGQLRFAPRDAYLVATSVALTRGFRLPSDDDFRDRLGTDENKAELIDGLCVTFMFNVVNRIANAHNLKPEWGTWRLSGPIQRLTQTLMAWGLPLQMPLACDSGDKTRNAIDESLLQRFGVSTPSPIWSQLYVLPTVEVAIYQLMWAAAKRARAYGELLDDVTRECLSLRLDIPGSRKETRTLSACQQLFAEPYQIDGVDWEALPIATETKLDILIWVAMLAAIHMLNGKSVRHLLTLWKM